MKAIEFADGRMFEGETWADVVRAVQAQHFAGKDSSLRDFVHGRASEVGRVIAVDLDEEEACHALVVVWWADGVVRTIEREPT